MIWKTFTPLLSEPLFYPIWIFVLPFLTAIPFIIADGFQLESFKKILLRSKYPTWKEQWTQIMSNFHSFILFSLLATAIRITNFQITINNWLNNWEEPS